MPETLSKTKTNKETNKKKGGGAEYKLLSVKNILEV